MTTKEQLSRLEQRFTEYQHHTELRLAEMERQMRELRQELGYVKYKGDE